MNQYPDFIRFIDCIGYRMGKCRITNIHDGLIYFNFQDGREYIIPRNSVILIIKDAGRTDFEY